MEEETVEMKKLGCYGGKVIVLEWETESGAAEETMLLWGIQQPTLSKQNAFVSQSSLQLRLDACGHSLSILQSPSSLGKPGVTGAVMWDSGVVLGKFLEHAVDLGMLVLQGRKVIELGSGCGLVGCIAALLGAQVVLTDLPDRLRLLKKNVETNLRHGVRGSAAVKELTWGDDPDHDLIEPPPDYEGIVVKSSRCALFGRVPYVTCSHLLLHASQVLGSDVIYSEGAVVDLLDTLLHLCGTQTTVFLSGELRNDTVLECFLEAAVKDFAVGRVDQSQWHPEYCSRRVVMYILVKK
ncbi:S-adenosyl-L-methionine-dependent methyltransferases superfamily protein [Theobroma cacao]|uniref:S-adenosyl-L-methionine-dependent methyltransferases superfamily protein n=1 Tax=Theobroma cacao TaxID=3641 RepID=A0A061DK39_THECC|nr:S-adenosyl-L-methionine-dependent methyltransferases superfamily protein [Theobroma cacao]